MPTCFVIQPFDSGKYDKRFESVFKPAIKAAGMEAYRVDQDASATVLIEAIETNIKRAAVCLADITTDNPNVWYELGFALASGRPVVMVCADERHKEGKKFPFDIQHRAIVTYTTEAPQDFERFQTQLTERLRAMLDRGETLEQISEGDKVAAVDGLSQQELVVLAVTAGNAYHSERPTGLWGVKQDAERAGLNSIGFSVGLRRLKAKGFVCLEEMTDENQNEPFDGIAVTDKGWQWIEDNESKFVFHTSANGKAPGSNLLADADDIPF